MYKCQIVPNKQSREGDKLNKIVALTRPKTYMGRIFNEETRLYEDVVVGVGYETSLELNASQEGVELWESWSESQRTAFLRAKGYVR